MEYLIYTIVAAVAFWLGWHVRGIVITINISRNPDTAIKMLEQIKKINAAETVDELNAIERDVTDNEMTIEKAGNTLYAYSKESGQFLAQGTSLEDICSAIQKRFPGKTYFGVLPKDDSTKELA